MVTLSHNNLVIGVDAGGTSTLAWLSKVGGTIADAPLSKGHAGPGNPRAVGFAAATQAIAAAVSSAFADAALAPSRVASLCLCVAGAGRATEQEQLSGWADSQGFADCVTVTDDAQPILAAASSDGVGIALISGTGSLALGRSASGRLDRVGGWGHLLGDEGSGYSIAIAGLRAATLATDGRAEQTMLLSRFMERFDLSTPAGLIESVYGAALSRQQLALCCEVVFEAAQHDDVAQEILNTAGTELSEMVITLARKLSFTATEYRLGIAGGVLLNQPAFRAAVMGKIGIRPEYVVDVPSPVAGACILASRSMS
ncbi:MAG: N-acetylglucosamine kinase [Fuerstiella sp.]|jgi:N-acetylglucosamine kinase-like BadF-type ATPase|nr:N-acetylglucosamine kinase [Fuerstiella sp.]MCP4507184.1 N-acetylglucosamine kinase [Fuerstiella sp.]MDG2129117.1 BadF/BadG/BcrA/BcrD ATPase family protein [Fuerstiella sp.]